MDVAAGIAAVAVAYPEAGVLFFDVSDPSRPRFLSRNRGPECEGLVIDVDCGAEQWRRGRPQRLAPAMAER
jgi:hypothetical protein